MTAALSPVDSEKSAARERLIVALDLPDAASARAAVADLRGIVGGFKIGLRLFTAAGPSFVREIVDSGEKVFLDLKFHDIPNTVAAAAVEAARLGVWMINVHALGGREMMRRAAMDLADVCERERLSRPLLIAVTVLTSADRSDIAEIGLDSDVGGLVVRLARIAAESGLDGVVASSFESKAIREGVAADSFVIVTPGIRPSGATSNDQKRVLSPYEAVRNGSDYLVIGRPILDSPNRQEAAAAITDEICRAISCQN